jgi:hypothetical protein
MKKTILLLSVILASYFGKTQDDYTKVMLDNIRAMDTTTEAQSLASLTSIFSAIYEVKKDWHPLYYECLGYIRLSQAYRDTEQKKGAIDRAGNLLDSLPETNDEVLVLRALYGMNYLGIDRSEWQTFLPMVNNSLNKAEEINPDNPRSYYLQGKLIYNMPANMGGGHEEGIKLFKLSLQKFETYHTSDVLAPNWGKNEVQQYLSKN